MMLLKKAVYGKLAEKVNNIDTNDLVLKPNIKLIKQNLKRKFLI